MNREEEEHVLHITAQYVAEQRAGRQPRLSDYLLRYPRYATAITDFVTYYHAFEVDIPGEMSVTGEDVSAVSVLPPLSENSRMALDHAWGRVSQAGESHQGQNSPFWTMQLAASRQQKSLSQLAGEIGLSVDVMQKLAQRIIDGATIPQELLKRLSRALELPLNVVAGLSGSSAGKSSMHGVAEAATSYALGDQYHVQGFREALEESVELSNEQKIAWYEILDLERL